MVTFADAKRDLLLIIAVAIVFLFVLGLIESPPEGEEETILI